MLGDFNTRLDSFQMIKGEIVFILDDRLSRFSNDNNSLSAPQEVPFEPVLENQPDLPLLQPQHGEDGLGVNTL